MYIKKNETKKKTTKKKEKGKKRGNVRSLCYQTHTCYAIMVWYWE